MNCTKRHATIPILVTAISLAFLGSQVSGSAAPPYPGPPLAFPSGHYSNSEDISVVVVPSAPGPYEDYDEEELVEVEQGEIDGDLDKVGNGSGKGSEKIASKTASFSGKSAATPTTCGTIYWRATAWPGIPSIGLTPYISFILEVTVIPPRVFPGGHFRLTITPALATNQRNLITPFIPLLPLYGGWGGEYTTGWFSGLLYTGVASRVRIYTGGMVTACKVRNDRPLTVAVRAP